jgi:hypothetical protein
MVQTELQEPMVQTEHQVLEVLQVLMGQMVLQELVEVEAQFLFMTKEF